MNGVNVGSIEDNGEDMSVILKSDQFVGDVDVNDILSLTVPTQAGKYVIGDLVKTNLTNATALISREDGDVQITVDADLNEGGDSVATQSQFLKFAESYDFPS
jgi:multidrug efflux pump subunit AcrB